MPKKGAKFSEALLPRNLTIYDYANNKVAKGRISKGQRKVEEPKLILEQSEEVLDMDEDVEHQKRKKNTNENEVDADHVYNEFTLDFWFMISEYMQPEDVGRFALICKTTHYVASTAKFWYHLYYRYYKPDIELPLRLQPDCMRRLDGLRSAVIRSLFYTYPPFAERPKFSTDLSALKKLQLIGTWFTKTKNLWATCFKFCQKGKKKTKKCIASNVTASWDDDSNDFGQAVADVTDNPEECCKILTIFTARFIPVPTFISQKLFISEAMQPLSKDLRSTKVKLEFVDYSGKFVGMATFDPIVSCKIHDWWSPEYNVL